MATSFNDAQQTSHLGVILIPLPIIKEEIFDLLEDSDLVTEVLFEYYCLTQDHSHISLPVNESPTAEQIAPEQEINTEARNLHFPLQPLPEASQFETRENQVTQAVCQQGGPSEELKEEPIFDPTISATPTDSEVTSLECLGYTDNREECDLFFDFNKYERSLLPDRLFTDRSEDGPSVLWTEEASRFTDFLCTDGGGNEHLEGGNSDSDADDVEVRPITTGPSDAELDDDVILIDKVDFKRTAKRAAKASRTPRARTSRVAPYSRPTRRPLERPSEESKNWPGYCEEWDECQKYL